jgi:hypothetical protein
MNSDDVLPLSVYIVVPLSILASHWLTLHFEVPIRRRLMTRLNQSMEAGAIMREPLTPSEIGG